MGAARFGGPVVTFSADDLNARQIEKQFPWLAFPAAAKLKIALDVQDEAMKLALVVPPSRMSEVWEEVERRSKLFEGIRRGSPKAGEAPQVAALRSVYADATCGRLS